jgi:hypothetical protein
MVLVSAALHIEIMLYTSEILAEYGERRLRISLDRLFRGRWYQQLWLYCVDASAGERAVSRYWYLCGLQARKRWYQQLQSIINAALPAREQYSTISISVVHHISRGSISGFSVL